MRKITIILLGYSHPMKWHFLYVRYMLVYDRLKVVWSVFEKDMLQNRPLFNVIPVELAPTTLCIYLMLSVLLLGNGLVSVNESIDTCLN